MLQRAGHVQAQPAQQHVQPRRIAVLGLGEVQLVPVQLANSSPTAAAISKELASAGWLGLPETAAASQLTLQ